MIQKNNSTLNYEELFRYLEAAYIVFDVDDPDFTIIEENQAHADIMMSKHKNLIGKPFLEALPDSSEDYKAQNESRLFKSIRNVISTGKPDVASDLTYDMKNEKGVMVTTFWEAKHFPVFEKGKVRAICQQTNDVSQRHRLEGERLQYYIDLNKTKDEFISLASHQLRTPATGVKQYLGMVLEGMSGDVTASQQALLRKAYESNERQLAIVSELLKVAQIDAGKVRLHKVDVSIAELLSDVIKEQENTYRMRKQTLQFTIPKFSSVVRVDPDKIRMVFENIIDNASKYSDIGKTIRVNVTNKDNAIIVAVQDSGVGIAKEDKQSLFEKFNRLHNSFSSSVDGTGLGLYWAKKVVDLHGGIIEVSSVLGKGSTFSVHMPKNDKIPVKNVINGGAYER